MTKNQASAFHFLLTGVLFIQLSSDLDMGTITDMGPGMFPMIIAAFLCMLAVLSFLFSEKNGEVVILEMNLLLKMLGMVFISTLLFKFFGILLAVMFLVFSSSTLHKNFRVRDAAISTAIAGCLVVVLKFTVLGSIPLW